MTIAPNSWIPGALKTLEDTLANSANFRTILGTTGDAAPWPLTRALIIWQDSRSGLPAPMAIFQVLPGEADQPEAKRVTQHTDQIAVYMVWPVDHTGGSTDKDYATLALNLFSGIIDDVLAAIGNTSGGVPFLTRARIAYEPPERTPDDSTRPGCWDATLTFSWTI